MSSFFLFFFFFFYLLWLRFSFLSLLTCNPLPVLKQVVLLVIDERKIVVFPFFFNKTRFLICRDWIWLVASGPEKRLHVVVVVHGGVYIFFSFLKNCFTLVFEFYQAQEEETNEPKEKREKMVFIQFLDHKQDTTKGNFFIGIQRVWNQVFLLDWLKKANFFPTIYL